MERTLFVQIASYRDPQLIPTLLDLIERATRPDQLRIVVCWQHALDETVGTFFAHGFSRWHARHDGAFAVHTLSYRDAGIELIDVPHHQSQGACWARNLIQQRYRDERYTLQLDSHHYFVDAWDEQVIAMLESLRARSAKPLLTTYLPGFQPGSPRDTLDAVPTRLSFQRFMPEGVLSIRSDRLDNWQALDAPVPSAFYSAHFAFADGHFAVDVRHDPHYFFLGEEISIAVRAFTHGYDMYSPHRVIAWHEYTRRSRVKIWDDHTPEAHASGLVAESWHARNARSYERNRALLGVDGASSDGIDFGPYGLGAERTLAQYEAYAGISFAHRGVGRETLDGLPPTPDAPMWTSDEACKATLLRSHDFRVWAHRDRFTDILPQLDRFRMNAHAQDGAVIHRGEMLGASTFHSHIKREWFDTHLYFAAAFEQVPAYYTIELFDRDGTLLRELRRSI
ncbi:GlcNAc-transferase family protein [Burkholderia metallica]